jgi:hypothetical protein
MAEAARTIVELGSTRSAWASCRARSTVGLHAEWLNCGLARRYLAILSGMVGVRKYRQPSARRRRHLKEVDAFGHQLDGHESDAGGVAARPCQRLGNASYNRIAADTEDDGHLFGCAHHGLSSGALADDHDHALSLKISNGGRDVISPLGRVALEDADLLTSQAVAQGAVESFKERRAGFACVG